jgi:hypothetical protein
MQHGQSDVILIFGGFLSRLLVWKIVSYSGSRANAGFLEVSEALLKFGRGQVTLLRAVPFF